ncbi:MAG: J domain-containing protein [Spirochaetia bacterium]|nr:J domain-containing protein [Spirochaetia bacterium]
MFELRRVIEAIEMIGLKEIVDDEQISQTIKRKYYERAMELHPDKSGSTEEFQKLLAAYQLLSHAVLENEKLVKDILLRKPGKGFTPFQNSNTQDYVLYKKAVKEYSLAIEEYFEKVKQVSLDPNDPVYQKLCVRMQQVKKDLFEVVKINPAGIWVADCIEKISRINVWLKNEIPIL